MLKPRANAERCDASKIEAITHNYKQGTDLSQVIAGNFQ